MCSFSGVAALGLRRCTGFLVTSWGCSPSWCTGFSSQWPLLLQSVGSRLHRLQQLWYMHLSCSSIWDLPRPGSNQWPCTGKQILWLSHKGSPSKCVLETSLENTINYTCLYKAVPGEERLTHLANLKFESIQWWNHPQKTGITGTLCGDEPTIFWRKEKRGGWNLNQNRLRILSPIKPVCLRANRFISSFRVCSKRKPVEWLSDSQSLQMISKSLIN